AKPDLEKFYDYKYWRGVQRNQLTVSSNIYFGFSTALIGYSLNLLINNGDNLTIGCCVKVILIIGILLNIFSLCFYVIMTNNKLEDYRETSQLILRKESLKEISNKTKRLGERTWEHFNTQKILMIIGFVVCLIAYS